MTSKPVSLQPGVTDVAIPARRGQTGISVPLVNSVEHVLSGQVLWKREGKLLNRVFKGQELHLLVGEKGWTCEKYTTEMKSWTKCTFCWPSACAGIPVSLEALGSSPR